MKAQWITVWTAVGAVASTLYFGATLRLLFVMRDTLEATKQAADATQKAADATMASAAVAKQQFEQSRTSWLLENNPLVWFQNIQFTIGPEYFSFSFALRNSGRAPAEEVMWHAFLSAESGSLPVKPSAERKYEIVPGDSQAITRAFSDDRAIKTAIANAFHSANFFDLEIDVNYQSPLDLRFYRSFVIVRRHRGNPVPEIITSRSGTPIEKTFTTNQKGVPG